MDDAPFPPRRGLRFSLRQLGALVVFVGMAIALVMQYRELDSLRREVRKLRDEAGYLSVDDPAKIYAIGIPTYDEAAWSWKIHVPAQGKYVLYTQINDVPEPSLPPSLPQVPAPQHDTSYGRGLNARPLVPGECIYTVALRPTPNGEVRVTHKIEASEGDVVSEIWSRLAVPTGHWPLAELDAEYGGVSETCAEGEPHEPLVLLRYNVIPKNPAGAKTDGIYVWIVRVAE